MIDIRNLNDGSWFRLFPEAEDVFADNVDRHAEFLLPFVSVDVEGLPPLHFVVPIEPYDGVVGETTDEHHTYYCRPNQIAFHVEPDSGQYRFATDFRFFAAAEPIDAEAKTSEVSARKNLESHYAEIRQSFAAKRNRLRQRPPKRDWPSPVAVIGGQASAGNWSEHSDINLRRSEAVQTWTGLRGGPTAVFPTATPLAEDGTEFVYVGKFEPSVLIKRFGTTSLLFYSTSRKIALLTFDWS